MLLDVGSLALFQEGYLQVVSTEVAPGNTRHVPGGQVANQFALEHIPGSRGVVVLDLEVNSGGLLTFPDGSVRVEDSNCNEILFVVIHLHSHKLLASDVQLCKSILQLALKLTLEVCRFNANHAFSVFSGSALHFLDPFLILFIDTPKRK